MIYQTLDISEVYVGNNNIVSGYVGSDLIFPSESPTPPTPTGDTDFLNFTAVDGDAVIALSGSSNVNVMYSFNKFSWQYLESYYQHRTVTVPNGQTVYLRGDNEYGFSKYSASEQTIPSDGKYFVITGTVECHGSVQSLLYESNFDNLTIPNHHCFAGLFYNCRNIITAPELPATSITEGCYTNMFYECRNLITAPTILPAITLQTNCYNSMFDNCQNITKAPVLPATTLAHACYMGMFVDCHNLTTAPALPALNLKPHCYDGMFMGCRSLTTAPVLPALELEPNCYFSMFRNCSNINYIKAMFITLPTDQSYINYWVQGVAANGLFIKNRNATWNVRGENGVPNNWTIQYE